MQEAATQRMLGQFWRVGEAITEAASTGQVQRLGPVHGNAAVGAGAHLLNQLCAAVC